MSDYHEEGIAPERQERPVLSNEAIRMEFDGAGYGLSSLQPAGTRSAFACSAPGLYTIELSAPSGEKTLIGSADASSAAFQKAAVGDGSRLILDFTHALGGEESLQVRCSIRLPTEGGESEWQIDIENRSGYAIQRVKYPLVCIDQRPVDPALPRFAYQYDLNAEHASALLLGLYDGIVIPEPHVSIPDGFGWVEEHPGRIATQLVAYYDLEGGLVLYTRDGTGCPKLLGFERRGACLDISPTHLFPREFGKDAATPYTTSLAPFRGDWQAATEMYKCWALTQPWTQKTITERNDIPDWVKEGYPFLLYVQGRPGPADHQSDWELSRPRNMLPVLKKYEQWLGSPLVAVIFGWEKHCSWITPDVFPAYPSQEEFADLVAGLKENRSRVFLYTSGTRWAVKNPRLPEWDGSEHWEKDGRQASCIAEDGEWAYDSRPWALNHKLCVAAEGTEKVMDHYVSGFASLGIDVTQYDQNLGGESYVCYSDEHGHPPGYGAWMYSKSKEMLDRFLANNRKHNPDFATSVEEPNEILIPHLSMYDSRSFVYHGWPLLTNVPCLGVPMFSYLYHEFAVGFSGDYFTFLNGKESEQVKIGRIFSAGHLLCDFVQPGEPDFASAKPALVLYKNALTACRTYAYDFQMLGEMLPAPAYQVEECFALTKARTQSYYSDERVEYVYPENAGVQVPAVLITCWKTPEGVPGGLMVNMSERPQRVSLDWTSFLKSWGMADIDSLTLQNLEGIKHIAAPRSPGQNLVIELPALQVSLLKPA